MKYLFFDIASHSATFACIDDAEVVSCQTYQQRITDHEVVVFIADCLQKAGWSHGDLDRIACVVGPGGFTTLRIAVAAANTLAHEFGIPTAGIHLSDLCLARVAGDVVWLHSTKKDQLFVRSVHDREPILIHLEELPEGKTWVGELIEEHRAVASVKSMKEADTTPIQEVLPRMLRDLVYQKELLLPWYGRSA